MRKLVILVSGNGGNVKFMHQASLAGLIRMVDLHVIADRECGAVSYSQKNGISAHVIDYKRNSPEMLRQLLADIDPDLIITNWHKIIDADTVDLYRGKMINLHYALLPSFSGLNDPIQLAYEQGCKFIGPTCHVVDEGVDTGKILGQAVFGTDVDPGEARQKMFRLGCLLLLNELNRRVSGDLVEEQRPWRPTKELFAPPLTFAHESFDERFWQTIASA